MTPKIRPESGKKISLVIIGAQKAGTTSLKNYLGQHPALQTHPHKELSYFFDSSEFERGYDAALKKYFDNPAGHIQLVAKNAGLFVSEPGILRLKEHNPDCKLILILRNPVERTYSSFLMEKNYGALTGDFESIEPVLVEGDVKDWRYEFLIGMSLYHIHLAMVMKHFPREQVKIIRYRDFISDAQAVCNDIFKWMNVDASFIPDTSVRHNETHITRSSNYGKFIVKMLNNHNPIKKAIRKALPGKMDYKVGEMLRNMNKTNKRYDPIPQKMASLLTKFYTPHNNKLSEMTGMDFSDWNKTV